MLGLLHIFRDFAHEFSEVARRYVYSDVVVEGVAFQIRHFVCVVQMGCYPQIKSFSIRTLEQSRVQR